MPSGPSKPADGDLIPWSQQATIADNPLDARWYIPFVRAINERLLAINVPPIAEDTLHYFLAGPTLPGGTDLNGNPIPPNPTLWGLPAFNGGFGGGGSYYSIEGIADHVDGIGAGLGLGFSPDNFNSNPCSAYPKFVSMTASDMTVNFQTNDGDLSNPDQTHPGNSTFPLPSNAVAGAGWTPVAGDIVQLFTLNLTEGSGGFPAWEYNFLPLDYHQLFVGYAWLYGITQSLACYFVDPNVTFDGKTRPQIQSLLTAHQEWWDHFTGNALFDTANGFGDHRAGEFFFNLQLCTIFQTKGPYWPLRSDIAPGDSQPADWPSSIPFFGFTRKREREITTLSDPGTDGQVARFIYSKGGQWDEGMSPSFEDPRKFGPPSWTFPDTSSPPHPPTPLAEADNARKVMLHTGGTWTVHPDQSTPVDILTFYGSPQPGDIFGHWFINELKATINLLTTSIVQERTWSGISTDVHGVESGPPSAATGEDASSYGHTASTGSTEAVYMANQSGGGGSIYAWTAAGMDLSGPVFACGSSCAKLYVYSPAHGMNRDITFYLASDIPRIGSPGDPYPSSMLASSILAGKFVYNAAGLAALGPTYAMPDGNTSQTQDTLGAIWKVGTISGTSDDHVDWTDYVGSLPLWLPTWPAPAALGDYANSRGILLFPIGCMCNWKVSGGFKYVGA